MGVGKIFKTLIIIVVCVILGALVLNILLPNVTTALINSTEDMIFKATGMAFDFNSDGEKGSAVSNSTGYTGGTTSTDQDVKGGVTGFK